MLSTIFLSIPRREFFISFLFCRKVVFMHQVVASGIRLLRSKVPQYLSVHPSLPCSSSLPPFRNGKEFRVGSATHRIISSGIQQISNMASSLSSSPTKPVSNEVPPGYELIEEGMAKMIYPKVENTVFYNPVQVQNRDLSVLMLSLYAERRAERMAVRAKKKELRRKAIEQAKIAADSAVADTESLEGRNIEQLGKKKGDPRIRISEADIQAKADEFAKSINGRDLVKENGAERGIRVLDALAASGLRSIRYWKEVPGVKEVIINDLTEAAVEQAKENVAFNGLSKVLIDDSDTDGETGIRVQQGDATHVMYVSRRPPGLREYTYPQSFQRDQFDVIDLDPYGSSAPFNDGAVQAVVNGGMLAVTCTDMAALGGSHPETCYGRYGSMPITRAPYLQELALRSLLYSLSTTAAKYGRTIRPILSVGMNFYVRVFVEVWDDKAGVNNLSVKHGSVYQSTQCSSFHIIPHGRYGNKKRNVWQPARGPPPRCYDEVGTPFKVAGPIWLGPLHDLGVVDDAVTRLELPGGGTVHPLKRKTAIHGLLTVVSEELADVPLYYTLSDLCRTVRISPPRLSTITAALVNAGFRVSGYHKDPEAIKTDAPNSVMWDILRQWCRDHPPKEGKKADRNKARKKKKTLDPSTDEDVETDGTVEKTFDVCAKILATESGIKVDFTIPKGFNKKKKAQRFPHNPEKNWGPKKAASLTAKRKVAQGTEEERESKSRKTQ